tara:strand:- start:194 stop:565 length:372 start_codon:yes stop_codon:yes gene_type:complete
MLALTGKAKVVDTAATARDTARTENRGERTIDTLHSHYCFCRKPCELAIQAGRVRFSGLSVLGLSDRDVGFCDENQCLQNHIMVIVVQNYPLFIGITGHACVFLLRIISADIKKLPVGALEVV